MLGIVVPAHNEEDLIVECVAHLFRCAQNARLHEEPVEVVVVADARSDHTAVLATRAGATTLCIHARNVGASRALGAELMLARGARWLAFTDADTLVSSDWLAEQLEFQADAVCGTVGVSDWTPHGEHAHLLHCHFNQTYSDRDDHRHLHGANLGVSATAYRLARGFRQLACSEDVALVEALQASGARIAWSARPGGTTSARRHAHGLSVVSRMR
jgi:glycosyltransferase involved in cell wall biosynthesis